MKARFHQTSLGIESARLGSEALLGKDEEARDVAMYGEEDEKGEVACENDGGGIVGVNRGGAEAAYCARSVSFNSLKVSMSFINRGMVGGTMEIRTGFNKKNTRLENRRFWGRKN